METLTDKDVIVGNITRAVSYKGLDLRHFNHTLISKLVYANKLKSVIDIFNLTVGDLTRYGGKERAAKILANPPNKIIPLPNFIYALGLCFDDKDYHHKLAVKFPTLRALFNATYKGIENAIGVELATPVFNVLSAKRELAKKLGGLGYEVLPFHKSQFNGMFKGKEFVLSGRFSSHRQVEIVAILTRAGGIHAHTVRETTGFLLAGQSNKKTLWDRMKKARELHVPIIDQYQLKRLFRIYGTK